MIVIVTASEHPAVLSLALNGLLLILRDVERRLKEPQCAFVIYRMWDKRAMVNQDCYFIPKDRDEMMYHEGGWAELPILVNRMEKYADSSKGNI